MRLITRLAVVLSFVAVAVYAQVKETVTVSVVEVPVKVVDRDGNPIRGLKAENFKIVDEGKERAVTAFDTIDFASAESVKATSPLNPAARRNFMLLFDTSYSSPKSLERAQAAARDFVAKMVQKRDRVAVGTIDADKGFKLLTAFTTDRSLINAAIGNPSSFRGNDPLQVAGDPLGEVKQAAMSGEGDREATAREELNDMMRRVNKNEDEIQRQRIQKQVNILAGLTKSLRAVTGQKSVLLLSEGFDPRLVQGRAAGTSIEKANENSAREHGELWNVNSDDIYGSSTSLSIVDRLGDMAKRSDVILYAVDIKGLRTNMDTQSGYQVKSNEGLHLLADATGGVVFQNTNDLANDFEKVVKHQEVTYVLAFNAPTSTPGKFHKLNVKLVNVPSGARVIARTGYYEAGGENQTERTLSNAEIVLNDIPQSAIHVAAVAAPFATKSENAQVPVIVEANGNDLLAGAKNNIITTDVFVYAFDEDGLVRDSIVQRLPMDVTKVADKLKATGLKYYVTLSLPEGKYAIKTLVRVAENEAKGFARTDIVVPKAGDLALSPPIFVDTDSSKWLMVKGNSHDKTNAAYPFEVNGEPFVPKAEAKLAAGQSRKFVLFVQNAAPDELTIDTTPKATVVSQLRGATGSKLVYELAGQSGASTLNVTVKKKGTSAEQSTSVPLIVQ
jgi:VWFA-related protein